MSIKTYEISNTFGKTRYVAASTRKRAIYKIFGIGEKSAKNLGVLKSIKLCSID